MASLYFLLTDVMADKVVTIDNYSKKDQATSFEGEIIILKKDTRS